MPSDLATPSVAGRHALNALSKQRMLYAMPTALESMGWAVLGTGRRAPIACPTGQLDQP
jgi:hypothetical protein